MNLLACLAAVSKHSNKGALSYKHIGNMRKVLVSQNSRNLSYFTGSTMRFKQIDAIKCQADHIKIRVPFEAQTLEVKISLGETLSTLVTNLKTMHKNIKKI